MLPDVRRCFPHLTKEMIRDNGSRHIITREHPISHHNSEASHATILTTVQVLKDARRVLLPVYADLQFRLAWKLLPTRSRFWFLQRPSNEALCCAYPTCSSIETERHLFFDCHRVAALWHLIRADWNRLIVHISWDIICVASDPEWTTRVRNNGQEFTALWTLMRSITLHTIWTTRNKHIFEAGPPLQATTSVYRVYSIFSTHFRALHRDSGPTGRSRLSECLQQFPRHSRLGRFIVSNPRLFNRRASRPLLDLNGLLQASVDSSASA